MIATVKGKVFTGLNEGRRFTELPWVRKIVKEKLGFEPYPGTMNLTLPSDAQIGTLLKKFKGWKIPPEKGYFPGRLYKALIMGKVAGGVVRPEVPSYPENVLEVIAPTCLREEFHLKDGDEVKVKIWLK